MRENNRGSLAIRAAAKISLAKAIDALRICPLTLNSAESAIGDLIGFTLSSQAISAGRIACPTASRSTHNG